MYMTVTELAGKMHGCCEEIFENTLADRLFDNNLVSQAKNFTVLDWKAKHAGTIEAAPLPDLYRYIIYSNYADAFKACAIAFIVSVFRTSNIALLRQQHYDPQTGKFIIPAKTGNADSDGPMQSDRHYTVVFPDAVRQMINAKLVQNREIIF